MATLINGDGNPAVYAVEDADWYIGLLGGTTRILNRGLKFAYHVEDINTFLMDDGLILTKEGRRIQLDANAQDEITIPNGVQGSTQYYIVGYHLYTDSLANQKCETFIQQMDNATDTITENTFYDGATEVYVSLYRITQTELVVTDVELLLPYDTTQAQDRASLALSLSDLRASFMDADTALSGRITTNTNNIANTKDIISNVEEGNTATQAYSIGDYVQYVNAGTTYFAKVLSPIAIGDTFTNGTNVDNSTVAEQLGAGTSRTTLTPPTASGSYTYDGTEKSVVLSNYDPTKIEIQGTQSATNAGTYTCTAVLKDSYNYCWTDGSNAPKQMAWTIAKRSNYLSLSNDSVSGFIGIGDTTSKIIASVSTKSATGTITASSTVGSASISGDNVVLTLPEVGTSYSGTITVSDSGDGNDNPSTAIITLTNVSIAQKVTWANGTDAEIAAMVAALDAGYASADDTGWAVGDERSVSLTAMSATYVGEAQSAQTATFVIMDLDHYDLTTPTEGGDTKCHFVVGLKDSLRTPGYMNQTDTNTGSWASTARRNWCNEIFKAAIPSSLVGIFKQFKVKTAASGSSSETQLQTTDDYFALFAEGEIFSSRSRSNTYEFAAVSQIEWYKTSANRLKKSTTSWVNYRWWQRSPIKGGYGFCSTKEDGTPNDNLGAINEYGPSPFGVI